MREGIGILMEAVSMITCKMKNIKNFIGPRTQVDGFLLFGNSCA